MCQLSGANCMTTSTCIFADGAPIGNNAQCNTGSPTQDQVTILTAAYGARP